MVSFLGDCCTLIIHSELNGLNGTSQFYFKYANTSEREVTLRRSIAAAQRMLQKNPKCDWSRSCLEAAKETLQRLIVSRHKMLFRSSAAWWSKNGDKVNQQFF